MKALVFGVKSDPPSAVDGANRLQQNLANTPMALQELERPTLRGDDWLVLQTRLCGICGSDSKQVLMDFEGGADNIMTALISFPQVLGHEVLAHVVQVGPAIDDISVGDRVVLNPWLACAARGIDPPCAACVLGDYTLCHHFTDGSLAPGIHTGNSSDSPGGFGEFLPAHRSMVFKVDDDISDEAAVLADPFAVALHAVTRNPPPDGGRALVYGAGALGTSTLAILAALHPDVEVMAVARWQTQRDLAAKFGAALTSSTEPSVIIDEAAAWSGGVLREPFEGLPFTHPGGIDVAYDTIGSPESIEVSIRLLAGRATLVEMGVSSPGRFEWTPWYFKELRLVGSNAFGVEMVEGTRKHAIEHYLDLVRSGRVDITPMLTHRFDLDDWRDAFDALCRQDDTGAIKVVFDYR